MHATASHLLLTRPTASSAKVEGNAVSYFFALDTDGRIAWPFRYVWTESGIQPQRWRFGRWVQSSQLLAFMTGKDDQFVDATAQEVESWIQRHSCAWHSMAHKNEYTVAAE